MKFIMVLLFQALEIFYDILVSSYKKTKEISKIIDVDTEKIRVTREGFQGSELEALELTIKHSFSGRIKTPCLTMTQN